MTRAPNSKQVTNLNTLPELGYGQPFALYIARDSAGGNLHLTPAHRELVANDRPDLFFVHLTMDARPQRRTAEPGQLLRRRRPGRLLSPIASWTRSTTFKRGLALGGTHNLEVEAATLEDRMLTIQAKFPWESQVKINRKDLAGQQAVVWQESDNNVHQLRTFPAPEDWLSVPDDTPSACLIADRSS